MHEVAERCPTFVGVSPPCTYFSTIQRFNHAKRHRVTAPSVLDRERDEAYCFLNFAMQLCQIQHAAGRFFYHEHPRKATSWQVASVRDVSILPGVVQVPFEQCSLGLIAYDGTPIEKQTTIMTNSTVLADRLRLCKCTCTTPHFRIGGNIPGTSVSVAAAAAVYPPPMRRLLAEAVLEEHKLRK